MAIGDATSGTSTSGAIYFSGLGNGTDFSSMISSLVQVEQSRVSTYQTWQQTWEDKKTAFTELNTQMLTLRTALKKIDTIDEFLAKTASSTDTDALTATADGEAENGTYSFSVAQLAKNKMMVTTQGYSALTDTVNSTGAAAKMVYTYAGTTISNAIPAGATLRDVVNTINATSSTTGVRASTIYDGSNYYLQLRGLDTGAANSLVISGATTLTGFTASDFQTTQENQDAKLKINGWPLSNAYICRATNTISDVVTGLTLSLKSSGAGTITVSTDTDSVVSTVSDFVTQVNKVKAMLQELTKYDSTTKQAAILNGNYGLQMIDSMLKNITASPGTGFDAKRDTYISLSTLGLSTDATEGSDTFGQLQLDEDVLSDVLASNADAVARIFSAQFDGDTNSGDVSYTSYIEGITKPGTYSVSYTVSGGKIVSASIGGHPASFSSNSGVITGGAGYDTSGLVLTVGNLADGSYSHTVNLRQGKVGELVDELADLTDSETGPLAVLLDNYSTISDNIQKKIDDENKRINTMATHLKEKFARLDSLLGTYSSIKTTLESEIAKLDD
ncbi:flagellar filament capping protein FliD [Fundidesulfovibrio agrisoli]|uniref:flagellar filament capping protein FliD n=1 Tax=Fundidesulfovibrio agrisoli TaxID=2922717 RepID=UPI001FACE131|nr:flagellar filament capping protein FliD [Fundidesulfovibrio agrisoli]